MCSPTSFNPNSPPISDHPFAAALLDWGATVDRPMPWRGERDPYKVWLSEVILQQTRVAQGTDYYNRFVAAFPTVATLAVASEDEVLALWRGLGYYSRARNLHRAARQIAEAGVFPADYDSLLALPGVGQYTAAAVAAFAYDEPVAVVDGNVYRVLARYFGLDDPIDKPAGQRRFRQLADELLPRRAPAAYNQAIMDFGATVCTPKRPLCSACVLRESCVALQEGRVGELPVKAGKVKRRARYFDYVHIVDEGGALLVQRRTQGDIWAGLYDMPLVESATGFAERPRVNSRLSELGCATATLERVSQPRKHVLSHQDLIARFWRFKLVGERPELPESLAATHRWVSSATLGELGIPRLLERYLQEPSFSLPFSPDT